MAINDDPLDTHLTRLHTEIQLEATEMSTGVLVIYDPRREESSAWIGSTHFVDTYDVR